jgi:transcriptional regulator GlxA family with amidase domain
MRPLHRTSRPHRVAVLVFDDVSVFEMAVPCEVWGIDRTSQGVPPSEVRVCTADPQPLHTSMGFTIGTPHGLETLAWADTIVLPAAPKPYVSRPVSAAVVEALRTAHRRGARLASVCTGAYVIAATGLLDGRRATTHWMWAGELAARHPEIDVDPSVLYVADPDAGLFTSAGTAAGIDMCLHMVRLDHGAEVANTVARRMVVPPHRDGGQAQFVLTPVPAESSDDDLRATLEWASANLDRELSVDELARRAAMTPRTFARRFKQATGTTPLQWVLHQRVVGAQEALETTDLPIEMIALRCGFGSAAGLRQHFGRVVGTNPVAYRATFRRAS